MLLFDTVRACIAASRHVERAEVVRLEPSEVSRLLLLRRTGHLRLRDDRNVICLREVGFRVIAARVDSAALGALAGCSDHRPGDQQLILQLPAWGVPNSSCETYHSQKLSCFCACSSSPASR